MSWTIRIPKWHPTPLNRLLGDWRKRHRLKATDRTLVAVYCQQGDVPRATGKRRVTLRIILGPGQRAADPDAYHKSLLDALVTCGRLVDDNRQHVELAPVEFSREAEHATEIMLEDVP